MNGLLAVLPMAFVMIAGPQIISSVFLATSVGWLKNSLAYIVGAALSITIFVTTAFLVAKGATNSGGSALSGGKGRTVDAILIALLAILAFIVYRKRGQSEPPKWMGKLQDATPKFTFVLGFLLLGVFPTDIITSIAVGTKLAREGAQWYHLLTFIGTTVLLLAMPLLLVFGLGKRAQVYLPKVRDWMNTHSWIVSEIVIALFIGIEISSFVSA